MQRRRFEVELAHLEVRDYWMPPLVGGAPPAATLGFEFDLNYGVDQGVFDARRAHMPGATFPNDHDPLTLHQRTDLAGKIADGFETKRDGPRLEISTMPFKIDDDATFTALVKNIRQFAEELEKARKTRDTTITVTVPDSTGRPVRVAGHPTWLEHPRTVISRFPLVIHAVGSANRGTLRFPTETALWASPQATVTLPLAQVGRLIVEIQRTAGGSAGEALTGRSPKRLGLSDRSSQRLGLRSDLAVIARRRVLADRRARFGTALPDGSRLTETDFSPALTSFVTILVMYMLTSEIVDPRDGESEAFAKGSLPLNVKTPLREIFKHALSDREKFVFTHLYGDPARRVNIFKLAKRGATSAAGGTRLFPPHTHGDIDRFHLIPPTWNTLIELTVTDTPLLVTKHNTVRKKNHSLGNEILFAPLSSMLRFSATDPRIAIELRRMGFAPVGWRRWEKLMQRTLRLARTVNP